MSMYPVSAATAKANDAATSATKGASSTATDYQSMFMQLLATELQSQDPTQPMDPTTMVTQMVQINQLSDVSGIYAILQEAAGIVPSTSAAGGTNSGAGNAGAGNAISAAAKATDVASPVNSTTSHSTPNTLGGN